MKKSFGYRVKELFTEKDDTPKSLQKGKGVFILAMVIVSLLHFFVFYVGINARSIILAFQRMGFDENNVSYYYFSLQNFADFFNELTIADTPISYAFVNTLKYFVVDSIMLFPISVIISYFLYKKVIGYKTFRIVFYLPHIISGVVVVATFINFVRLGGPLEMLYNSITGKAMSSPFAEDRATNTIIIYMVWRGLAGNFILFGGAMNRIPNEIMESVQLENCGWLKELWNFVVPLCWDTIATLWIMSWVGLFQASGPILLFNIESKKAYTISFWIFKQVTAGSYAYPAAVGLLLTIFSFPIVLFVKWLLNKVEGVEY